jgi:cytochrome c553
MSNNTMKSIANFVSDNTMKSIANFVSNVIYKTTMPN